MKTHYTFSLLLLLALLITSCSKFLDTDLKSGYTPESFFTTETNAVQAVNGCYASLASPRYWIFGDVTSDDAVKGGSPSDQASIDQINNFTVLSDDGNIYTFWQQMYDCISQCNNVIYYVDKMDIPLKDRLIAEARFIRGYCYFYMINVFGSVPYKDKPQETSDAIYVGLSSVEQIYSKIESDLLAATEYLPYTYSQEQQGRVTRGAAYALLAKVYLFEKKYSDCLTAITEVETPNIYDLEPNYSNLFKTGGENSIEALFAFRYAGDDKVHLGNSYCVYFAPIAQSGYAFNAPTQSFVDCFTEQTVLLETDPRLDASIGRDGHPWFDSLTFSAAWSTATGYLVKKYNEENPAEIPIGWMTVPTHILRYADVLLMKAEAINESSGPSLAEVEVNKVRQRAGLSALSGESQSSLRDKIRVERRRELGFEGHRYFDIVRYGQTYAQAAIGEEGYTYGYHFPIPQAEIDANTALH
ncbi:MAG: RagB/SusD family nutrient uptake outer membrane protein [Bacteroidales bacterium]|jgi:hypothetical protein|nr:RagB/SusD family nutrient uptake outer membrane protein [Bacteroidales bacterium]